MLLTKALGSVRSGEMGLSRRKTLLLYWCGTSHGEMILNYALLHRSFRMKLLLRIAPWGMNGRGIFFQFSANGGLINTQRFCDFILGSVPG